MGILDNKVAIVTGASSGIGAAIAVRMAGEGASLAICGRNAANLADTAQRARALGARVEMYLFDASKSAEVQQAVDKVVADFGKVDILVNNAGITKDGLLIRMSEEDWDAVMDTNLKSVFLFTKAAAKYMMKARAGSIVNIASIIGLIGNAGQANYSASKGGIISFTKSVARELAPRGIRANAIAPGFIETRMTAQIPEDIQKKMLGSIPLGRFGKPEDVADAVAYLASDRSAFITGQVLSVCGGMVMS